MWNLRAKPTEQYSRLTNKNIRTQIPDYIYNYCKLQHCPIDTKTHS